MQLVGGLSGLLTVHWGVWRKVTQRDRASAVMLWTCWAALGATAYWLRGPWAAVLSVVALLAAHVVIARIAPQRYLSDDISAQSADAGNGRLLIAPLVSATAVIAGYINALDETLATGAGEGIGPLATLTICLGFWIGLWFLVVWLSTTLVWLLERRGAKRRLGSNRPSVSGWFRWQTVGTVVSIAMVAMLGKALATGHMAATPARELLSNGTTGAQASRVGDTDTTERWVRRWLAEKAKANGEAPMAPIPIVIVAAEGGGIRAAYWTASTLGALFDRYGYDFAQSVIATSGVSGGSVGVAVYMSAIRADELRQDCRHNDKMCADTKREAVQRVLGGDFLSPALMALMVGEPLRDFGLAPSKLNRATALELGLENRFNEVLGDAKLPDPMCTHLDSQGALFSGTLVLPGLTDARNGKRIVLSCLPRETPSIDVTEPIWLPAGKSLPGTTAAILSARLPVVSPAGLLTNQGKTYRIVDGGFSDNAGIGTAVEVLYMVHAAAKDLAEANCAPEEEPAGSCTLRWPADV